MPNAMDRNTDDKTLPDLFTRLSIAMCPQDDGTRPVDPAWPLSDIGFLSPAISFSKFPIPVGESTQVMLYIKNFGTQDAIGAWLETAYNVYLGNNPEAMIPVQNLNLPIIAAGGDYIAQVDWLPCDTEAIHACFHARVFDTFSLLHFPTRCLEWSSFVNPQAGHRNAILIKVEQTDKPVVVMFKAKNFLPGPITAKALVTIYNSRTRFMDLDERWPLPFVFSEHAGTLLYPPGHSPSVVYLPDKAYLNILRKVATESAIASGGTIERAAPMTVTTLWPREDINPVFIHSRFGFDSGHAIPLPPQISPLGREYFFPETPLPGVRLSSLETVTLAPGEERSLRLVIPPEQFPERGRRARFQVDYQVGSGRPVQYFVYLSY